MNYIPLTSFNPTHQAGPKQAIPVKPEGAAKIIQRAKKPVLAIGSRIVEHPRLIEFVERLHKAGLEVVATAHSIKFTSERGIPARRAGIVELTNLLTREDWQGFSGDGKPDLVVVMAINLELENATFESLKNYSHTKSLCIDRYFMINADYSFPTLTEELWIEYLERLCEELGV